MTSESSGEESEKAYNASQALNYRSHVLLM